MESNENALKAHNEVKGFLETLQNLEPERRSTLYAFIEFLHSATDSEVYEFEVIMDRYADMIRRKERLRKLLGA